MIHLLTVPTVNPIHWHIQSNRVMLVLDDEYFRADLTCLDRAVALESGCPYRKSYPLAYSIESGDACAL